MFCVPAGVVASLALLTMGLMHVSKHTWQGLQDGLTFALVRVVSVVSAPLLMQNPQIQFLVTHRQVLVYLFPSCQSDKSSSSSSLSLPLST